MIGRHGFAGADRMGWQSWKRTPGPRIRIQANVGSGETYAAETQRVAELQHIAVTQGLEKLFRDTQTTVDKLSLVAGQKSVASQTRCLQACGTTL
jgi:hypothetical protein